MSGIFSQKKILVTGAGSGLGREIALAFSRLGGTVILAGRNTQKLEETAQAISETPGKSWVIPFDANNNQSIDNLFDEIKNKVGTLDIAVNNAGVFSFGFVDETSSEDFNHVFTTNVIGLFESLKRELQSMKENRTGTIVNISSNMSIGLNIPGTAAYTASKAAVDALTRVSAKEAITHGVRVFSINPGPLATEMTQLPGESAADRDKRWRDLIPIGRIGDVKEIAEAIIWSCSGQSDYLVGSRIVIDGGHSL